jgi:hypothetical protein
MKAPWIAQAGLCCVAWAGISAAQETEGGRPAAGPTPLQVELAVHRQVGGKKAGTMTYTFPCSPDERGATLKFGVEVPVPVRKGEATEFQYRNVGANIECAAFRVAGGRYRLHLTLEQSSLYGSGDKTTPADLRLESLATNPPLFRTSMAKFATVLRDGQSAQAVSGTDPLSGEVTTADVTLRAEK